MHLVGGDDHAAGGDFDANLLRRQMRLAQGDALHFRRDDAAARFLKLRAPFAVAGAAKSMAVRCDGSGIPGVSGELNVYGVPTPALLAKLPGVVP
jgi:hypothetical protein